MTNPKAETLHELQTLLCVGAVGGLTDAELVHRFATRGDQAAFEALVGRHGPMVLRVCMATLGNSDDAQDACQATFLVFARRVGSIRKPGALGSWLHGVARRVSARSRSQAAHRRAGERRAAERTPETVADAPSGVQWAELHEEIDRLPENYRAPIVLCGLEGRTHEEAALQLGWPVGTVKVRLSRGRSRLGARLARRGLALSVVLSGLKASRTQTATLRTVVRAAAELGGNAGAVQTPAVALAVAVSRGMVLGKLKMLAAVAVAATGLSLVAGRTLLRADAAEPPKPGAAAGVREAAAEKPAPPGVPKRPFKLEDLYPFMNNPDRHKDGNLSQVGNMRPLISDEFGVRFQSREAVLYKDGKVSLWDWSRKGPVSPPLTHADPIRELRFVDHLNLLLTASDDSVKIWDGLTGALKKEIKGQTARPLFFTGDWGSNRFVTVAKGGRVVTTWDLTTFEPAGTFEPPQGAPGLIGAGLSGDGKSLATVAEDRSVTLWDLPTSQPYATLRPTSRLLRRVFPETTLGSGKPALQLDDPFWHSVTPLEPAAERGEVRKAH